MMKIQATLISLFLLGGSLCAQTITDKELQDIKGSFKKDASTKAIQNVLTNDKNIRDNALNRDIQGKIDHYQVQSKSTRNHRSKKLRPLLDVHLHERVASGNYPEIQSLRFRFLSQLPLFLGYV